MADVVSNDLAGEFITAARARVGRPFWHHYKPADVCGGGAATNEVCMRRGMDWHKGYDCTGLAIASMCEVLGIGVGQWPWDHRHLTQLESLAVVGHRSGAGDIVIMHGGEPENPFSHIGIQALGQYVHASGKARYVVEGRVERVNRTVVIPLAEFAAIPLAGSRLT